MNEEEADALQLSGLHEETPHVIPSISSSIFSPSRHCGGMIYNGSSYFYNPVDDTMVRDDVLKWLGQRRREEEKNRKVTAKQKAADSQKRLPGIE